MPDVREIVRKEFPMPDSQNPVIIQATADVTGDGTPEALIDLGCCGAYTDEMTVMRMEDGKPVLALFRGSDGKISKRTFLDGASVIHGASVKLMPDRQAIFAGYWDMKSDGNRLGSCSGEAFRWNAEAKTFDFNLKLNGSLVQDFCKRLPPLLSR
jgi:hypothetical protein